MKTCAKCGGTFPRDGFYADKAGRDGLRPDCKECNKRRALKYRYDNYDAVMEQQRRPRANPQKARQAKDEWRRLDKLRHPEKHAARKSMHNAIKRGEIARQPCSSCGNPEAQGHHHDYSKPFEIEWLCLKCHGLEHRRTPEGIAHAEKMMAVEEISEREGR